MRTETPLQTSTEQPVASRLRRSAAAVIAQYIEDLTHPVEPMPCAPGA